MPLDQATIRSNLIAFLAKTTNRSAAKINGKTKLASIGFDGFALAALGEKINSLSWMHGVQVGPGQMISCNIVDDLVKVISDDGV
jgi:hypothetical protein